MLRVSTRIASAILFRNIQHMILWKTDGNKGNNYAIILETNTKNPSLSCLLKKLNVYGDVHVIVVSIGDMILIGFHDIHVLLTYLCKTLQDGKHVPILLNPSTDAPIL